MPYIPRGKAYSKAYFTQETSVSSDIYPRGLARSIFLSQWAYWCTLAMAAWSGLYLPAGSIRTALIVTPVLPAMLIIAVSYWVYQACDEYIRLKILRCVAMTASIVALCTLAYFFLELLGFPRLSMLAVNLLGWSVFNLGMLYVIIRSR